MYAKASAGQQPGEQPGGEADPEAAKDEDVVDADFEEVDENK
jgi:hypothetical protein